jgi:hypothetical protein
LLSTSSGNSQQENIVKPIFAYAAVVVTLLVGIALSVPWQGKPEPVIVASAPPAPPLPKAKPAIPVKSVHKPAAKAAPKAKAAYSCTDLKTAEAFLTQAQLEAKAKERGATAEQLRAVQGKCGA